MIVDNRYEFYNAEELVQTEDGLRVTRFPEKVRQEMLPGGKDVAALSATGCEIRFVMQEGCDSVRVKLRCMEEFMVVQLYFGSFQGGWKYLYVRGLSKGENELLIERPKNIDQLRQAARERKHLFSPDVMRLCFRSGGVADVKLEGDIRAPIASEVPQKKILFYGSSITHGSLAYLPCTDYASLICAELGADPINKGCAGSCRLEPAVVSYLTSRDDYDFAVFELGSNIPTDLSADEFKQSVLNLLSCYTHAHPSKKAFVIDDLLVLNKGHEQRHIQVQECLAQLNHPNLVYINGYDLLDDPDLIAADFTHPTVEAHHLMAEKMLSVIHTHLS